MSYNSVPTVSTGDTWSAANHNTYIRDNFAAGVPDIFTAAGDLVYATAANAAAPLVIGQAGLPLVSNGSLPVWGSFVYKRQGGDADDWSVGIAETTDTSSSDNYTPAMSLVQIGTAIGISDAGDESVTAYVTFPVAFGNKPWVNFAVDLGEFSGLFQSQQILNTYSGERCSFRITFSVTQSAGNAHLFYWIAIGEPA
jgi:hypothetical protein